MAETALWSSLIDVMPYLTLATALCLVLLDLALYTARLGIGPTPSGKRARASLIECCVRELERLRGSEAQVGAELTIYELGSGWGGLSFALGAHLEAHERLIAFELAFSPYCLSRVALSCMRLRSPAHARDAKLSFERRDLIEVVERLQQAELQKQGGRTLLVCYLCPQQMRRLSEALTKAKLPRGVSLVSLLFTLPGFSAVEEHRASNLYQDPIWVYHLN